MSDYDDDAAAAVAHGGLVMLAPSFWKQLLAFILGWVGLMSRAPMERTRVPRCLWLGAIQVKFIKGRGEDRAGNHMARSCRRVADSVTTAGGSHGMGEQRTRLQHPHP